MTALDVLPFVNIKFDGHFDDILWKLSTDIDAVSFNIKTVGNLEVSK